MKYTTNKFVVEGEVEPGYESVKDLFISKYELGCEENSQICVYVKGKKVVDLWGRIDKDNGFDGDSLVNVFSSTKSLTSIVMAMAYDRGWIKYSDKIQTHWPEFAQNGKEDITITDLMKHESGMATPEYPLEKDDTLLHNIKDNKMGAKLAEMKPRWPKEHKREYHAITRGWIANEIFRRVHPEKMTIGEFLHKEISSKHNIDVYIGCDKENFYGGRNAPHAYSLMHSVRKSLGMKSGVEASFTYMIGKTRQFYKLLKESRPTLKDFDLNDFFTPTLRSGESPSANGNCSARGLAKIGSIMANKGKLEDDNRLMSESSWEAMHGDITYDVIIMDAVCGFSQGGVAQYREKERDGYFGWMGYGGSAFQWHPELEIGFAYTCTLLFPISVFNAKAAEFQAEVAKCAKNLQKQ